MNTSDQTKGAMTLTADIYTTYVEAFAAANQRMLGFAKSTFEIVTRPYSSSAVEIAWRENLDRAHQLVDLTVGELQHAGTHAAQVAESLTSHSAALQEQTMATAQGLVRTGVSNLTYVKETTDKTLETFASRVQEMQQRSASPSQN